MASVRAGSNAHNVGGRIYKCKRILHHTEFDPLNLTFGFALIELSESLKFDETVKPIQLPEPDEGIDENMKCSLAGWGEMGKINEPGPIELRGQHFSTLRNRDCEWGLGTFCAGEFEEDNGDCEYFDFERNRIIIKVCFKTI